MADRWFYAHETIKCGPCSARQLRALADSGEILPTDTVWKEGVEKGVLARKVKHLFPAVALAPLPGCSSSATSSEPPLAQPRVEPAPDKPAGALPPVSAPAVSAGPVAVAFAGPAAPVPLVKIPPTNPHGGDQHAAHKGRAMAVRGAVIVGQDGVTVKYRKKCTKCGHADSFSHSMPIRNGSCKASFFCPKCRKNRDVEIKGSLS